MATNSEPKKLSSSDKRALQDQLEDISDKCLEFGLHDIARRIDEITVALEDA